MLWIVLPVDLGAENFSNGLSVTSEVPKGILKYSWMRRTEAAVVAEDVGLA